MNKIKIERVIELEKMINDNKIDGTLTNEERNYLKNAIDMPYLSMVEELIYYQKNCLLIDKVIFINQLKKKYLKTEKEIENRIIDVQRIYKYYNNILNNQLKEQKRMIKRMKNY